MKVDPESAYESHNRLGGLDWHKNLLERAGQMGISVHEWMDGELGRSR